MVLVWQGTELGLAARVMVPDSLISAMAMVSGSDLIGDMLGEVEPLAVPEDRGKSDLGDSG